MYKLFIVRVLDGDGHVLFEQSVPVTGTDEQFDIGVALRMAAPDYPDDDPEV